MKANRPLFFVMAFTLAILISCSSGKNTSDESADSESAAPALSGTFIRGADTLKIVKDADSFTNEIEFDIYARNSAKEQYVFNTAPFSGGTEQEETYVFKDSSAYNYEDLLFTYAYAKDHWVITDKVYRQNPDSTARVNLSGIYARLK
jgi:hypothetical protein